MFNKVIIVGNLTRDIEIRYSPSGTAVGATGIATTRKFKGSDGELKEEVCFVDITFFGRTAEVANQYLKKGSKLLVEGRLKFDSWSDQNGNKRSKHSVTVENMTMLDSRSDSNNSNSSMKTDRADSNQPTANSYTKKEDTKNRSDVIPEIDIDDDEIPF